MILDYKKPFQIDRNSHGDEIMVFIRPETPANDVPPIRSLSVLEDLRNSK